MGERLGVESVDGVDLLGVDDAVGEMLVAEGLAGCTEEWSAEKDVERVIQETAQGEEERSAILFSLTKNTPGHGRRPT